MPLINLQSIAGQGGAQVLTAGIESSNYVIASYPLAVVTIYDTGTTDLVDLFSDADGLIPKANPFVAGVDASWSAYIGAGRYDVRFSGPTVPTPYTLSDITVGGSGGGGGSAWPPPASANFDQPFSATPTFDTDAYSFIYLRLTGNVTSSSFANPAQGKCFTLQLVQDGTGGRTFAWPSDVADPPTINSAANSVTNTTFYYDGTEWQTLENLPNVPSAQLLNPALLSGLVVIANAFPGDQLDGKIGRADAALGDQAGEIWVFGGGNFGKYEGGTSAQDYDNLGYVVIHENHNLYLGPGDYYSEAEDFVPGGQPFPYILPQSNVTVYGDGPATKLHAPIGYANPSIITPYRSALNNADAEQNIVLRDFQVVGQEPVTAEVSVDAGSLTVTGPIGTFTEQDIAKTFWIPSQPSWVSVLDVGTGAGSGAIGILADLPPVTDTLVARWVYFDSATPHIYLGNAVNSTVERVLFTKATSIAVAAGGNSQGLNTSVHAGVALTASPQTVSTGFTNPNVPNQLRVKGNAGGMAGNVTIHGTDNFGDEIEETFALSGSSAVNGTLIFSTVDSVEFPARTNPGDIVSLGVAAYHGDGVTIQQNQFVNCVSQNAALVNSRNSSIIDNQFTAPGQLYGPGVSVIDLETNAAADIIIANLVDANIINCAQSPVLCNTGIAFTNNNLSGNGGNRITNNTVIGIDVDAGGTRMVSRGLTIASSSIHDVEVSNNYVVGAALDGMSVEGGSRYRIFDNTFAACGSAGSGASMSFLSGVLDSLIERNQTYRITALSLPDVSYINDQDVNNLRNVYVDNYADLLIVVSTTSRVNSHATSAGVPTGTAKYVATLSILGNFTPPVGAFVYCTDCNQAGNPCTAGGSGTQARFEAGAVFNCGAPVLTGATPAAPPVLGVGGYLTYAVFVNGGATTVTNITGGVKGQLLVIVGDANTTVQNNANIVTRAGANITPFNGLTVTLLYDSTVWRQVN